MVSAMQTLVQVVNKHGCAHASPNSVTYEEGIACGEVTNDKMRPFLANISHDPNARHLIPKNPAEEERLYNTNAAYKKASDDHDEFSEAFQAVYSKRGGGIYNLAKVNAVLKEAGCDPVTEADDDDDIEQKIMDCITGFRDSPKYSKDIQDKLYAAMHGPHVAGRRIGPLKKGKLTDLGYHPSRKATSRHRALSKAVKKYGKTSTLRKVNAVAVLTKRRAPLTSRKYRADVKYLQKRYF